MKANTIIQELLKRKEEIGEKGYDKCILPKPSSAVTDIIKFVTETGEIKSYEDGYSKGKKDWAVVIPRSWIIGEGEVSSDELLKAFNLDPEDEHNQDTIRIPCFILKRKTTENKEIPMLIYEICEEEVEPETYLAENMEQ